MRCSRSRSTTFAARKARSRSSGRAERAWSGRSFGDPVGVAKADTTHRVAAKVLTLADLELETLRALNGESLRHPPEEVAAFLNERSPEDTALLLSFNDTPTA